MELNRYEKEILVAARLMRRLDLRTVKGNQDRLQGDIEVLLAKDPCVPGFSLGPKDFRSVKRGEKGHGRLEHHFVRIADFRVTQQTSCGETSLTKEEANPGRLLQVRRAHWGIENGLYCRRDETLRGDRCVLTGQSAHAMSLRKNLVVGRLRRYDFQNVPDGRRYYTANLEKAVALVFQSST